MKTKIKIYIFHPFSRFGGADLSISRLINGLNKQKYSIEFITLNNPIINKYLKKKIKITIINKKKTIFSIFQIRRHLINERKINKYKKYIFLSNQNFANVISFFITYKLQWIKKVLIERNHIDEFKYENDIIRKFKNLFIKIGIKLLYKHADRVIGISKNLSKDLSHYTDSKVTTIYNPAYDPSILQKTVKIKKHGHKIILNVARLENQKNHFMLLRAFKIVSQKIHAKLFIIGYGSQEKKIKHFIKFNNLEKDVFIIKNQINNFNYYKIADLFVLTSNYEGFGNVLVEAGSFKVPIISTNCKSGPSEILGNGKYGSLIKINDYIKLAKTIIAKLNKKDKKNILLYKSLSRFNLKNHINSYEGIFDTI
jgi:glycosyltransferase involved in cell wall biosynthesis